MIELKGISTTNKGAHLMLLSVLKEFEKRDLNLDVCTRPRAGMDYKSIAKYSLFMKEELKGKKIPWSTLLSLLPEQTLRTYGLVQDKNINFVLDASGFAYGDYWGPKKIHQRLGNVINNKVTSNCKLILLPQALGPFHDPKVKSEFAKVVERADIIFARDEVSYNHLLTTYGKRSNFRIAPDFTNLLDSGPIKNYEEGNICIIPNYKMITNNENEEPYFKFFIDVIEYFLSTNNTPYFLIHEGEKDREIAQLLNQKISKPIPIVEPFDAIEIKNRIKSSVYMVGSRFHGYVSGLSQGVCSLSTSWSHKYQELAKDYEVTESVIDINNYDFDNVLSIIKKNMENQSIYKNQQKVVIEREKKRSVEMWNEVFLLIKS